MDAQTQTFAPMQSRFLQQLLKYAREKKLFAEGDRVLLACSGGLDSSVLADALTKVAHLLRIEVEIVHVDHGVRGVASEREGVWVEVLSQRLGVPGHRLRLPKPTEMNQAAWREARREVLEECAKERRARRIATAHHADDNAETFLMRAVSGAGSRGLSGIAPVAGLYVRPLLWATRAELLEYARTNGLAWVEDPSNERGAYLRNRLRREVLPKVEELRQGAVRNLARAAERLEDEEADTETWLRAHLHAAARPGTALLPLDLKERFPRSLQRRLVKVWLEDLRLEPLPALVEALLEGEDLVAPQGTFFRRADSLQFSREMDFGAAWSEPVAIEIGKRFDLGTSMAWSFLPGSPEAFRPWGLSVFLVFRQPGSESAKAQRLAWDRLPWPLVVRTPRRGEAEVERLLKLLKIPAPYHKAWPLLCSAENPDKVVALVGLQVLPAYRADASGRSVSLESFFEDRLNDVPAPC